MALKRDYLSRAEWNTHYYLSRSQTPFFFVMVGLLSLQGYGESALARTIACRWLSNFSAVYQRTGKLVEKYDVADTGRKGGGGVYPAQDGFGWTNGVTERLLELYPDPVACARQLIAHPHN